MEKNTHNTIILTLLQKYIDNRCSEEELRLLFGWLKSAEDFHELDFVAESLWDTLDKKIAFPDETRRTELNREVEILIHAIRQKEKEKKTIYRKRSSSIKWIYRIAAVALLAITLSLGFLFTKENVPSEITYVEKTVPRGETMEYTLSDGTHVILNSESRLVIPSDFNEENRVIEMNGEGFFDVKSNPKKPFIIKSGNTQVKVLGTSFNVKTYAEDDIVGVTVSTGNVLVNVSDQDLQLRVTPNEHLLVNKINGSVNKQTFEENNYIKWMDGALFFDKEPIREVIKTINRKYERQVVLQCRRCDFIISGMHDNKNIQAVVEAICFTTGLKQKSEGDYIILYE